VAIFSCPGADSLVSSSLKKRLIRPGGFPAGRAATAGGGAAAAAVLDRDASRSS